jgi:endoglucanase
MRFRLAVLLLVALSALTLLLLVRREAGVEGEAFRSNRALGRGINLAHALEAPTEGAWGVTLKPEFFQTISEAGFDTVRIPIHWPSHAPTEAPFSIAPEFFARVDWAIQKALSRKLHVVINIHHYGEIDDAPQKEMPRLLALWDQIASHYRDFPDTLLFELLNEPCCQLTDELWQDMFPKVLRTVRKTNPRRIAIIGPGHWNSFDHLEKIHIPQDDQHVIVTFHYYLPMQFTHQTAYWIKGSAAWKGTTWTGTAAEKEALVNDFRAAAVWARQNQRPLYLGEFGAYEAADLDSRVRWTAAVAREAEKHGFSWAYWDFSADFGAYDAETRSWRQALLQALIPNP